MGSQTGGRMQVLLATRSLVGLLATLAIAKAAKLNEDALYHVVEDLQGNETQESEEENVATCSDVMARNGLNFSPFWHGAAHGLHSLHLEEIRHFFEPDATEDNKNSGLEEEEANIADLEGEYLSNPTHETALSLLEARPWKGNSLVGPEEWVSYQAMLTASMLESEELNDFATFMYCRLNQPDTDHPKELFE